MKRSHREDKLAKLYDTQILPIWSQRFGRPLLRDLKLPPKAMILDVACGTGFPALELAKRMDDQSRIIAIDPSPPMLDEARAKAGALSGKRIFFRTEAPLPRLSFADDVYDVVVSNAALGELDDPEQAIREFVRVTRQFGQVAVTLPLAGTFGEFFDIFREVLTKRDMKEAIDRLDAYLVRFPPIQQAEAWFEDAGLGEIKTEFQHFQLLFKSSREFFFAPVIEFGPLADWKTIAGKGQEMQDVFWDCKNAIDTYFAGSPFAITVMAGYVRGTKLTSEATRRLPDDELLEPTGDDDRATQQIDRITAEREVSDTRRGMSDETQLDAPRDDDDVL